MPLTPAESLYQEYVNGGEPRINQAVTDHDQEHLLLDFKVAAKNTAPMQTEDQQKLAESISAFANSDGGVIVWGVYATNGNNREEPDAANDLRPISKIETWLSNLNSYTGQHVAPVVVGVKHYIIRLASDPTKGYAVTFIPKYDGQPIMARAKEQHRYYMRSGSNSIKMEHYTLADRFSRRPPPKLAFYMRIDGITDRPYNGQSRKFREIVIGIANLGTGIAQYPALRVTVYDPLSHDTFGIDGNRNYGLRLSQSKYESGLHWYLFTGGADNVVYPGTEYEVTKLLLPPNEMLHLDFDLFCDGFSGKSSILIPSVDVVNSERTLECENQ